MNAGTPASAPGKGAYNRILERTLQAYTLGQQATAALADLLATKAKSRLEIIEDAERELDQIDREVDASLAAAITDADREQARELLSCMKMVIDLERVGDLLASVASCTCALGDRLEIEDAGELIRMTTLLERMLADTCGGFTVRNVDRSLEALRLDAEVDRLRNLLMMRHLERAPSQTAQASVHVLFMAQGLERAGDHVKNLAEEICHLVSGQSLRHLLRGQGRKSEEQMYLDWLRRHHSKDAAQDRGRAVR